MLFQTYASSYNVHVYQISAESSYSRSVKTGHTHIFANDPKLHKFATTNSNFENSILLDMHHHKTYMYINFQEKSG